MRYFFALASCLLFASLAAAEKMPEVTIAEAVSASDLILEVKYTNYEVRSKISYGSPPHSIYEVIKVLKGSYDKATLAIQLSFKDHDGCIVPVDFEFNENMMPAPGGKGILLLKRAQYAGEKTYSYYLHPGFYRPLPIEFREEVVKLLGAN